jgi:hypothetical protein
MADNFLEKLACGRIITEKQAISSNLAIADATIEAKERELQAQQTSLTSLKKQLVQAQQALVDTDKKNKATIAELQIAIAGQESSILSLQRVINAMTIQSKMQTDLSMLSKETQAILNVYQSKYPEAEVIYIGRCIPNKPDKLFSMRVQAWAQAGIGLPEAVECVDKANAWVLDIMKEKGCTFHRACDISLMRLKIWVTRSIPYKYQFDNSTTGMNEFWKFFIELYYSMKKYGIGDDCDGWAVFMHVLWRTAGIPRELLRIIGCTTRGSKEGHATNGYFSSDCKWRHCNSTTPYGTEIDALALPLLNDKQDAMGPEFTWFSYDEKKSWSGDAGTRAQSFRAWYGEDVQKLPKMLRNVKVRLL